MASYRKKPVVVEAYQWFEGMQTEDVFDLAQLSPKWFGLAMTGRYVVKTLEGLVTVSNGDYIITGIKGEKYPCKPDIFAETYEAI